MINYYLLTKPGIVLGNLVTLAAGFLLASKGQIDLWLFFYTLFGLSLVMASACVFNNYIDRPLDKKMQRTQNRSLVTGVISGSHALIFGYFLAILGAFILGYFTNFLTLSVAGAGFFIYVFLYSFWKGRTIYGTAIGSLAGAVPPVAGYSAASNHLDAGALILFAMLVLWQMPHFFAIAISHLEDYRKAKIPVLPVEKGLWRAKIHMLLYVLAFSLTAMMLSFFNYTGQLYLIVAACCSAAWFILCLQGFRQENSQRWGKQMFQLSLIVIGALSLIITLETIS